MPRFATAGTKIYIGSAMDDSGRDLTSSDFTSQTWTEIGNVTNIGVLGDAVADVSTQEVGRARDVHQKGTANAQQQTITVNINSSDAGQIAFLAAAQPTNKNNYAFRVVFPDAPATGSAPKGSERLYIGLAMQAPENLGGPNQFAAMDFLIQPNSNIVKIPASAGS